MTGLGLDELRRLRCRIERVELGPGPDPLSVVAARGDRPGTIALVGEWAGGGALVTGDPLCVVTGEPDPIAALRVQPAIDGEVADVAGSIVGGGWFGWLGYDTASSLGFYDWLLRWSGGTWWFEALASEQRRPELDRHLAECRDLLRHPGDAPGSWQLGRFGAAASATHLAAVENAVELIRAGEIYQVNVCTRLSAPFRGGAASMFAAAAEALRPRFGAFVVGADRTVVSLSPELFVRRRDRTISTSPIKGTTRRDGQVGFEELRDSAKDAAENVMIVDLMRNDFGRICVPGTVRPSELLGIQAHPGVWHLVSTVTGQLRPDVDDADVLAASFPPGSVTGAPKLRAIEAIAALESSPRGVYTGALGFASPVGGLEFSVAIRTFEVVGDRIELGVGGGVTADSVPMREWHECRDKATPLLAAIGGVLEPALTAPLAEPTPAQRAGGLLETVLVLDVRPVRLSDHLARLDRSARELYGQPVPAAVRERALEAAREAAGPAALRIVLADATVQVTCRPLGPPPAESSLRVVRRSAGLWRHKWAARAELEAAGAGAALFVASDGTVLETTRGNVFLLDSDGTMVTPPLRDDLLPGVTRRAVLDAARDVGRPTELREFGLAELQQCCAFWTSSLSGLVPINAVDGRALPRDDAALHELRCQLDGVMTIR